MDSEHFYIFKTPATVLKAFGFWISKSSSFTYKMYGIFMHLLFFEVCGFFMTMYLTSHHGIAIYAEVMSVLPVYFSCIVKTINFMRKIDEIEELFVMVRDCTRGFVIDFNFHMSLKEVHHVYKAFWGGATLSVFLTIASTLLTQTMSVRMWLPFEMNSAFRFWMVIIFQNLDSFGYTAVNMAVVIIPVFFMCYIASLLKLLCRQLENLKKENKSLNLKTKLKTSYKLGKFVKIRQDNKQLLVKCINNHLKILELTRKLEEIFSAVIFIECIVSTFVLCTTAFLLTVISPITQTIIFLKAFFLLITWALQILLPCYYSQRITFFSENLATSLFHSDWICEDREYQRTMMIFMEKAKQPLKISALGLFEINLDTFMKIINTAYSFYAVFKRRDFKRRYAHNKHH